MLGTKLWDKSKQETRNRRTDKFSREKKNEGGKKERMEFSARVFSSGIFLHHS